MSGKRAQLRAHRTGRKARQTPEYGKDGPVKVRGKRDAEARVNVKADLRRGRWA